MRAHRIGSDRRHRHSALSRQLPHGGGESNLALSIMRGSLGRASRHGVGLECEHTGIDALPQALLGPIAARAGLLLSNVIPSARRGDDITVSLALDRYCVLCTISYTSAAANDRVDELWSWPWRCVH
jgi:hypothetical protein